MKGALRKDELGKALFSLAEAHERLTQAEQIVRLGEDKGKTANVFIYEAIERIENALSKLYRKKD